ncbi:HipA domain-containing protein [Nostoc ellipsosporum NOK]|nr:HipA domain-containing protein [Nostoc ellipsosporum NOK]
MKKEPRCLYCYQPLKDEAADFHEKCSRIFFGTHVPPVLDYSSDQMQELAKQIVVKSIAVTGVQPKLSLEIEKNEKDPKASRLTIVGLWGGYILKPPTKIFPHIPENEDLTMHLSELLDIPTAQHSLIRLKSGELAYITKRFDRSGETKLAQEDMCQLTETLTEDKYRSSMEKVGKHILKYSSRPGLDVVTFFELSLLCFLTGNADMHLKNFSLLTTQDKEIVFSPAYDLVSTKVAMPEDLEEMALTINARKRKIKKADFMTMAKTLRMAERAALNSFQKLGGLIAEIEQWIDISFMPDDQKKVYKETIKTNALKLEL